MHVDVHPKSCPLMIISLSELNHLKVASKGKNLSTCYYALWSVCLQLFNNSSVTDLEGTLNEQFSPFPRFAVSDARVYIICVNGLPRLQTCGAHDQFHPESLTCVRRHPGLFYY